MSQSSSSIGERKFTTWKQCNCGGWIRPHTSWTELNPGRRFEACEKNQNKKKRWHYWEWVDKETCPRGKEVLPGLLRRLRGMENEVKTLQEEKNKFEDKVRILEAEKKKLEAKIEELRKNTKFLGSQAVAYQQREKTMWVALVISWLLVIMMLMVLM